MATTKKSSNSIKLRNNKLIYGLIIILTIIVFIGSLMLLRGIFQTETYYVLKQDVPTRTQITPEMLAPVVTSEGSAPIAAKGIAEIQAGDVYSRFPLIAGDILTDSNIDTGLNDIANGVPDTWVVTSFGVGADNAVGGRIHRGDYFDLMIATPEGSYYPFVNILALDTTVSLNTATSNQAADTEEAHAGQTSQYVVGMSPGDAARLHQIVKAGSNNIRLVISPKQNQYAPPKLSEYSGLFKYTPDIGSTDEQTSPKDMGKDTDYTFSPVKRDEFGRPIIEENDNCSQGNGQVSDPEVCKKQQEKIEETETSDETQNNEPNEGSTISDDPIIASDIPSNETTTEETPSEDPSTTTETTGTDTP